ncbi:transcriptional regulator [Chimaeribacter californicus]|uniref:Transcriptional regulator n=2 Tax=Chimaeribacter californicus TaxID=2060067 RepID=A0A2N5DSL0_9GAMM|nr:transcriptional regulator [Chimaeribacter californicus]
MQLGIRPETLEAFSPDWPIPTAEEVAKVIEQGGRLSSPKIARLVGVNDRTVRRWLDGTRTINYAQWSVLVARAGLGNLWELAE